jgi:phosphohistidine swiveling domain-containing protein
MKDWTNNKEVILESISKKFKKDKIIVRSSCIDEDSLTKSKAGYYYSELDISPQDSINLTSTIEKVISNYNNKLDQVLIQRQTEDIILSGVLFTSEVNTNSPYYIINYSEGTKTNWITSGKSGSLLKIFKEVNPLLLDLKWKNLITSINEIETIILNIPLDIEFAVVKDGRIVIFQVRPLAANTKEARIESKEVYPAIRQAEKKYKDISKEDNIIFSDMSFWNPAELIGNNPSNLAYSLFNELIMKKAWNTGLVPLGYPDTQSNLMERFLYKPYINVNTAFKALVPTCIPENINKKLQEFYLEKLKDNPELHDKIEFEIVFSCYDFRLQERMLEPDLTNQEVMVLWKTLVRFTKVILEEYKVHLERCRFLISRLDTYNTRPQDNLNIEDMLDKCQEWGTIPFTTAARLAFIAKTLLQSLESSSIITPVELDTIMNSFTTVVTELVRDSSILSMEDFMNKYGHLRSGTYDIKQKRYADISGLLLDPKEIDIERTKVPESLKDKINIFLSTSPLKITFEELYDFSQLSFSAREYYKFVFTHTMSNILELIKERGKQYQLIPEELSYLDIEDILNLSSSTYKKVYLKQREEQLWNNIILPSIIFSSKDFWVLPSLDSKPNFITNKIVEGEIIILEDLSNKDISNKIILIDSADPGYHWIFSKSIKGLVTKYGGVASHMAICCAELGIPAAIGCGELYDKLKLQPYITLDCSQGAVR